MLGGMHNVHVNTVGEAALKKGGPYPNGTVFMTDLHDFAVVDGSYVEGALKGLGRDGEGLKKIYIDRWLGLSILGGGRSEEAESDRCRQRMF